MAPRSGRRPVRNLCSVQEALTGGLDEAALAEEPEVECGSDLAHGDEQVEKSLRLSILWLVEVLDHLDLVRLERVFHICGRESLPFSYVFAFEL